MPYWRLSAFYFFYFATLGALIPYWGLYLRSLGFSVAEIGQLMAIILATKILAPNLWAWVSDHTGRSMPIVRLASLLTMLIFMIAFWATDFWSLALVMTGFSFFWNASLPQLEATTMNYLGVDTDRYGRVRLWGSLGFILAVAALGPVVERLGPAAILPVVWTLMGGIWLASLIIPEQSCHSRHQDRGTLISVFRRPEVRAFIFACFLMQASHAPYYAFFSIYLQDLAYPTGVIGLLWAFGVVCEIGVFLVMHRLSIRFALSTILLLSFFVTAVRWILIASFPEQLGILALAQAMHAVTFGAYHATAIQFVHRFFKGAHQHRGQAIYSSMSFGVGGAVGSFLSGYAWLWWGAIVTWWSAAILALVAWVVTLVFIRPAESGGVTSD